MILKDNSKTFKRKFKELIMTRKIEKHLTKQDILVFYLNMSYFGNGKYGISNASDYYFGKNVSDLTLEESAMLVGLLKAPSKYNPTKDEELTKSRTKQVILNMKNNGFINDDDVISYLVPSLDLDKYKISNQKKQNFYFSDYAFKQVKNLDLDKNFLNLSVITTLNKYIQEHVVKTVQLFIEHNATKLDKSEIAIIIMGKDGEILSMVGGRDYSQSQFNRVISAKRQVGSLFKLFIYLAALENNLELKDVFMDEKIKIGNWYPENNDGVYRGKITVKDAFATSSNSVAVQIADYFGIDETIRMCNKLGIVDKYKNDYSILLGTRESTLFDIVNAYATIVNDGKPVFPHAIKYILNNNNIIYKTNTDEKASIFKENTIKNMQYLLYTVVTEGTAKGAKIRELIEKTEEYNRDNRKKKYFIGGKTGTTQNNRDAWFVGFANDYIIGVWIGNDDNTPTNKITGGGLPVVLWRDIVLGII
jgi:penicillin-binding protein 1A